VIAPEVPTFQEAGLPGFEVSVWTGVFAPARTPAEIIDKVNRAIDAALKSPELSERLLAVGIEPVGGSAEEAQEHLRREVSRWKAIIDASGLGSK